MPTVTIRIPKLYAKQKAAIFDPARISVIEASTKAGKTVGCICWQLSQVLMGKPGINHWWIAPVYAQAQIAYERVKRYIHPSQRQVNDSEMRLTFRNDAKWTFKSGEKPDNLFGEDVYSAVIDEATRLREDSWHAIRTTLTATRGPIRIIGNVKGRKNWAYRLGLAARQGQDGMAYHRLTAHDAIQAGVLRADEVEQARHVLPDAVFRELYLAEPTDDGGNPFGVEAIRRCVGPRSISMPRWFGIDLAKSTDWTVCIGLDADGAVCVLERWQSDWRDTQMRIENIVGETPTLIDSTGVGDPIVESLSRSNPTMSGFKFTSASKQQLMEGLASAIQHEQIRYPDGWLVEELEAFEYVYYRTGVKYSAPEGVHDDGVCALALATQCMRNSSGAEILCSVTAA